MAGTFTWTHNAAGSSGNWSTATDWSPVAGAPPGSTNSGDTTIVQLSAALAAKGGKGGTPTYTVNFDETSPWYIGSLTGNVGVILNFNANTSLTVNNATKLTGSNSQTILDATGASLTAKGGLTVQTASTLAVSTGVVSVSNGATLTSATMNIGTGSGSGTLIADNLNVNGGGVLSVSGGGAALSVSGNGTVSGTGNALTVEAGGSATFGALSLAKNSGSLTVNSSTLSGTAGQLIIGAGDAVNLSGGTIDFGSAKGALGILNNGVITGYGTLITQTGSFDFEGNGSVIASGGLLSLGAAANASVVPSTPQFSISNSSTLQFSGAVGSGATIDVSKGTADVLSLTSGTNGDFHGTVSGFAAGDTIQVAGAASYVLSGSTLQAYDSTGGTGNLLQTVSFGASSPHSNETLNGSTFTVCFAAGSRIRTEDGDVPVEQLTEGQRVAVLRDGAIDHTPITWIGERRINLTAHPQPQTAAPVRILRGAIGENLPERDLVLSPDHCLFLDGKLIPAKALINGMTIVQDRDVPAVHYFHVEVDPHAVLLAEGLPVESYLDTGNRAYFQNCGAALVLHPEFTVNAGLKTWETHACAPLTVQPDAVRPIWQRLVDRAESLGFTAPQPATTEDADLHLVANGRVVRPMTVRGGRTVFALPAGCDSVRLVSRATIPSDLAAYRDDWRSLGVAVSRITVRAEGMQAEIPADHPNLMRGWHPVESDGATTWRWTSGDAELGLPAVDGPAILEVQVCNTATYIVAPAVQQADARLAA